MFKQCLNKKKMARKNTVWGARHVIEEEEIRRIIEYYQKTLGINITKLEASAIQAERSMDVMWTDKKAREILMNLRGIQ